MLLLRFTHIAVERFEVEIVLDNMLGLERGNLQFDRQHGFDISAG